MEFSEYQKKARKTKMYPKVGKNFIYPLLGLAGETGEIVEKFKKLIRDKRGKIDKDFLNSIELELGDVLWYLSNLATELNLSLENIAKRNLEKLFERLKRNKIKGEGDNR